MGGEGGHRKDSHAQVIGTETSPCTVRLRNCKPTGVGELEWRTCSCKSHRACSCKSRRALTSPCGSFHTWSASIPVMAITCQGVASCERLVRVSWEMHLSAAVLIRAIHRGIVNVATQISSV